MSRSADRATSSALDGAMKILLLGADGQVGHELLRELRFFADVVPLVEPAFDITRFDALSRTIDEVSPDAIVNATAYNDVDGAERDPRPAMVINTEAVGVLGEAAKRRRCALVHFSTDFVFDGKKGSAYVETDATNPLGAYARSKLGGERALVDMDAPALIFRTAWVYSARKKSFVSAILRLAREREQLNVVSDQVGNPTFCRDLADAVAFVLYCCRADAFSHVEERRGVYHLAGTGACSRYDLARAVVEIDPRKHEHKVKSIDPVDTGAYPSPAARPASAPLDCDKARRTWGLALPAWRDSLVRALEDRS
jgi:dTDP-4-dehydrorhamnose reductase